MAFKSFKKLIAKFLKDLSPKWVLRANLRRLGSFKSVPYIKPHSNTYLTNLTHIGKNCHFNGMKILGKGKVIIGDNFHSGEDILIITQNHNYDTSKSLPYDKTFNTKDSIIEDNVWIGSRVIILGGIKIGEGAIIQAGSVVVKDIPKFGIAGGYPAKVFKYRDIGVSKVQG
ncbi:MAG: acyltransferase [Candidatus Lokiarchaeota archaeon]